MMTSQEPRKPKFYQIKSIVKKRESVALVPRQSKSVQKEISSNVV